MTKPIGGEHQRPRLLDTPKKMADVAVTFLPQKSIAPKYFGQIPKAASEAGGPEKWVWSALNKNRDGKAPHLGTAK